MRLRLYLNGDGTCRGTHVSLFLVLLRGIADEILKFPFSYKISFCLFDQTSARNHIIDSFNPDIQSVSFQKPSMAMNIASGIPKFAPVSVVKEHSPYMMNDTIFLKVMIHFEPQSRSIIRYAFNLNPGLPANIRRALVDKEIKRTQTDHE